LRAVVEEIVEVSALRVGDLVRVRPGERVPVAARCARIVHMMSRW
jgi:cation transport ATPase